MPDQLSPDEHRKLIGILGLLASDQDGERATAGLMATRLLQRRGLTWADVIARQTAEQRASEFRASGSTRLLRAQIRMCLQQAGLLSEWERKFLRDLLTRNLLTPAQIQKVHEITQQLRERCAA